MADLLFFVEDDAQERFIGRLVQRIAAEVDIPVQIQKRVAQGGFGSVLNEVSSFYQAWQRHEVALPDVLLIGIDANCHGIDARRREVDDKAPELRDYMVYAIADPHIERWLLLDGHAFKAVLGQGCSAPDQKCEKDRYKQLLTEAIRQSGVEPLLGGIEYAEDIAGEIDLQRASASDRGFSRFVNDLRARLQLIKASGL